MVKFIKLKTKTHTIELITNGSDNPKNIILCLHGFNGDRWGDGFDKLKNRFDDTLICSFDSAGHGKSEVASINMRIDLIIQEIDDVVEYLRNKYQTALITLFAGSYGGYRAVLYLAKYGEKIEHSVLINPAFKMLDILQTLKEFDYNNLKDDDVVPMKKSLNKFLSKKFLDDIYKNNVYEMMAKINKPIKIFLGKNDTLIPSSDTLEFAKMVDCDIAFIDDEHLISKEENWDKIRKYLGEIL